MKTYDLVRGATKPSVHDNWMAYSSGQEWAEQRNFNTVLSTAKFIQNWNLRDSAVRASYVVS